MKSYLNDHSPGSIL